MAAPITTTATEQVDAEEDAREVAHILGMDSNNQRNAGPDEGSTTLGVRQANLTTSLPDEDVDQAATLLAETTSQAIAAHGTREMKRTSISKATTSPAGGAHDHNKNENASSLAGAAPGEAAILGLEEASQMLHGYASQEEGEGEAAVSLAGTTVPSLGSSEASQTTTPPFPWVTDLMKDHETTLSAASFTGAAAKDAIVLGVGEEGATTSSMSFLAWSGQGQWDVDAAHAGSTQSVHLPEVATSLAGAGPEEVSEPWTTVPSEAFLDWAGQHYETTPTSMHEAADLRASARPEEVINVNGSMNVSTTMPRKELKTSDLSVGTVSQTEEKKNSTASIEENRHEYAPTPDSDDDDDAAVVDDMVNDRMRHEKSNHSLLPTNETNEGLAGIIIKDSTGTILLHGAVAATGSVAVLLLTVFALIVVAARLQRKLPYSRLATQEDLLVTNLV